MEDGFFQSEIIRIIQLLLLLLQKHFSFQFIPRLLPPVTRFPQKFLTKPFQTHFSFNPVANKDAWGRWYVPTFDHCLHFHQLLSLFVYAQWLRKNQLIMYLRKKSTFETKKELGGGRQFFFALTFQVQIDLELDYLGSILQNFRFSTLKT